METDSVTLMQRTIDNQIDLQFQDTYSKRKGKPEIQYEDSMHDTIWKGVCKEKEVRYRVRSDRKGERSQG